VRDSVSCGCSCCYPGTNQPASNRSPSAASVILRCCVMTCKQQTFTSSTHTHTHTHTHTFNGPLSGTTRVSRYQKGETNLDFTEARDSEWQWHQRGRMQVCISLQTDNHASTPLLSFLQARCPSCRPTNSVKALKAFSSSTTHRFLNGTGIGHGWC